jgi:NADPH:quinone reductase-like Zn-dependent oxidoreductase
MKAAQYNSYGGPEVIVVNPDAPTLQLKDGQILVEVHAASPNPFDFKLRRGYIKDDIPLTFPVTIGGDYSGVVVEVAAGLTGFHPGDEVYGQALIINGGSGSFAEFVAGRAKNAAQKPKNVEHTEAASMVLVGVSAIQALEEHIKLSKDQKILIHGGAGGIGSIAVQLAKHLGAYVVTTVGTDDVAYAKELGADEVIDYKTQKFEEIVNDFDAVFDTAGGETLKNSIQVLKRGGILDSMVGPSDETAVAERGITALYQDTRVTTERLNRLTELVERGVVKPHIAKIFSLDRASDAYDFLENSHPKGKVVVRVK